MPRRYVEATTPAGRGHAPRSTDGSRAADRDRLRGDSRPAGCPGLTTQLATHLDARLKELRLTPEAPAETFSTPRRLTARVAKLSERQTDFEELVTGPPVSAAFKPDGEPTPAAAGFAKKYGVEVAALERHETPKGAYLALPRAPARQGDRRRAGRRHGAACCAT